MSPKSDVCTLLISDAEDFSKSSSGSSKSRFILLSLTAVCGCLFFFGSNSPGQATVQTTETQQFLQTMPEPDEFMFLAGAFKDKVNDALELAKSLGDLAELQKVMKGNKEEVQQLVKDIKAKIKAKDMTPEDIKQIQDRVRTLV